ncbi:uroporphyrinogen-III C-methyltransferase [Paucibacter sp. B2R-40]|uniref:uroporphyrinogen-III C-methyltransferase n=1 Tax=Paucibacter sp. B2R-40 TaxID=2893554 RepID=UPI0021E50EBC|nr:uroporphyrinogen-III C-methyltransferase [Paucibacter sp. B2R-40]MCV2356880.1 uroporphyrinogen-III C-methyltransferase [Paucibacter sp. B2R-40]
MNSSKLQTVSLVGAGPGDPELLTVKALKRIQAADVILSDDLVDPRVLALAHPAARILYVGKRGGCVSTEQRFIHDLMIREASSGARVVRLKGGDPFMFGRGSEEVDALREAGIEVEVVSGLTSGIAAPASIGIPVTDRRHAPGVAFVTGHSRDGARAGEGPDWAALARSRLTLVIYMGLSQAEQIVQALIEGGLSADTPAAAISAAHTAQQRQQVCHLAELPAMLLREQLPSPAILVVGQVVRQAQAWDDLLQSLAQPVPGSMPQVRMVGRRA